MNTQETQVMITGHVVGPLRCVRRRGACPRFAIPVQRRRRRPDAKNRSDDRDGGGGCAGWRAGRAFRARPENARRRGGRTETRT